MVFFDYLLWHSTGPDRDASKDAPEDADNLQMGLVSKLFGTQNTDGDDSANDPSAAVLAIADGALDTLSSVIQVMGSQSFPLENEFDAAEFPSTCMEFVCHVENGAAVPSFDIPQSVDGTRDWAGVRRFFADRRKAENSFVTERLEGYRGIVDDLVTGLREIGLRDQNTESSVLRCLNAIEDAVVTGTLPQIKAVLSQTLDEVTSTFAEQRDAYESQLQELNERMSSMRQDLVAAREEMKRDALTEAFNRGAFDAAILQSVNAYFILRQPVTVLMIDLDDFKRVNDTWGHAAGDEILRAVGDCLARSFIRKNDFVARFGGDEFAVILPDTSAHHTQNIVDRLLANIRDISIPFGAETLAIRCSIGYTEIVADDTVEDLVRRADDALYQAKADGRDQSVFVAAPGAGAAAKL